MTNYTSKFGRPDRIEGSCEFCDKPGPTWMVTDAADDTFEVCAHCYQMMLDAKPPPETGEEKSPLV